MSLESLLPVGGVVIVILSLIQISPIKINPWGAIARCIGRAINHEIMEKLDETKKTLDKHIAIDDARNADLHRGKILQFNNELLRDIPHTREDFIEVLAEIDKYERYCANHKEYENNRAVCAVDNIKRVYKDRLEKHDFLQQ